MKTVEFVNYLQQIGVELRVEGERLICNAPKGVLNSELSASIAERKADILKFILQLEASGAISSAELRRAPSDGNTPLSFEQESLWILDRIEPNSSAYNLPGALRIRGELDKDILQEVFKEILRRHEVLRTTIRVKGHEPVQVIQEASAVILPFHDYSGMNITEREVELSRFLKKNAAEPFDLAEGPLFRFSLVRLEKQEHILFFVAHHCVFDGESFELFYNELSILYEAYRAKRPAPFSEFPVNYRGYAFWQRKWLEGKELELQLKYWLIKLNENVPVLELPTIYSRPIKRSTRGAAERVYFSKTLTEELSAVGRFEDATLFMVVLAAFKVLLHRYTGQEKICVGWPITTRALPETEKLIGMFVNTLAVLTEIDASLSFRDILRGVRSNCIEAYSNSNVPFQLLVKELKIKRDSSRTPLYQVMLAFQSESALSNGISGLSFEEMPIHNSAAQTDLRLEINATESGLHGIMEYSTDLFDAAMIERLINNFQVLLEGVVANPEVCIADLPILTENEIQQVLVEWNATKADYPENVCLHELFERQVEITPDAVALVDEGRCLTYRELNERSNRLGRYLRRMGVGPEVLVGLFAERSLEMVVGIYGILKAGGAYVPLDPDYPSDRLEFMIEDTKVQVILSQQHLIKRLPRATAKVVCLDSEWGEIAKEHGNQLENGAKANNAAYVIFTSGSTGRPKGVVNEHRGIVNRLLWMQDEYKLTAGDSVLQKTPFSFDVSVWEFFWPLLFGAKLVMAKPDGHRDPAYLVETIKREGITTLHFVPSMLQMFLEEAEVESCNCIRRVICSGEALPYVLQRRFFERLDAQLHNLYGPTEAAVDVTYWACQRDSKRPVVPIGRPVANTQIYILDRRMQPVPIGVTGELYIGGVQVARGYLNRPELTAERFVKDPFSEVTGARLYRTGDLARYLPDGAIEYLGRVDFQVKIRGLRVELGEIEARIEECNGVGRCAVVLREDVPGDKRIVAYYVKRAGADLDDGNLRNHLQEKLPEYMVPQHFVELGQMPLTASGKVDRKALPKLDVVRKDERQYLAPRNKAEKTVAEIWQELLGVEKVGLNDNFFELGGHSLLVMRMAGMLNSQFSKTISVVDIFRYPTVEQLATFFSDTKTEDVLVKTQEYGRKQREALGKHRKKSAQLRH